MMRLDDTSGSAVAAAISAERRRLGSPTTGMVLTLLILSDEDNASDATSAAVEAARQHPMRILTLIPKPGKVEARLDAQISVGGDQGPGEVAELRLRGELAGFANSVAVPLLLPDTPVVAFWPGECPAVPADDLIGRHAQRRITDAAGCEDPLAALHARSAGYRPGDTDLTWARLTPWRSVLASALDHDAPRIDSAAIWAEAANPSALLLQTWLRLCLGVTVELLDSDGPGITGVSLRTRDGDIRVSRPDGVHAVLSRPGVPDSPIALRRRDYAALVSEELRRLDPDEVYGRVITGMA
ncbi:MAG: oxppcycle protein [Actinomycetota bacterium]|jgi:glucose-6-phosphate dehydrogenase assembly protein OpcA